MQPGYLYAIAAYLIWGFFPIYWYLLRDISSITILAHRVVWSLVLALGWLLLAKRIPVLWHNLKDRKIIAWSLLSGALIAANWLIYVWAVNAQKVLETSLGYFINPLVNVFLGTVLLREKMRSMQWLAVTIAAIGVIYAILTFGGLPWIGVALALTFGLYGLVRKVIKVGPVIGLGVELVLLSPMAFALLLRSNAAGRWMPGLDSPHHIALLVGSGVVSLVPLLFFSAALKRLPYSTMALFHYLSPTLQFLCAIFFFHEPISLQRWISFSIVWLALGLFTFDLVHNRYAVAKR